MMDVLTLHADNWLRVIEPAIQATQDPWAIVESGIQPGDRVVVGDLAGATDGMLLEPVRVQDAMNFKNISAQTTAAELGQRLTFSPARGSRHTTACQLSPPMPPENIV